MPIRPIDREGTTVEVVEEPRFWQRHGAKVVFLVFVCILGIYFFGVWRNLAPADTRYVEFEEPELLIDEPGITGSPKPTRAYRFFASEEELQDQFLSPEETWEEIKKESQRLLGESVASAGAQAEDLGNEVLGEATQRVQDTASESADQITTTIYKNTIGQVILQLFNQLPQGAQDAVIEDINQSEQVGEKAGEETPDADGSTAQEQETE